MKALAAITAIPGVRAMSEGVDGVAFLLHPEASRGDVMVVIVGIGGGWDHVSVSCRNRTPTWDEMERVKRLCFEDTEVAMQLHVAVADHISVHPYVLHMWRPQAGDIPLPPVEMV